jgi:RHS repeat-associated protein
VDFDNGLAYDYQYDSLGNRVQSVEDDGVATPITTDYHFDSLLNGAMSGPVLENVSDNSARFNLRADSGQLVTQAFSSDVTVGVTPFAGAEVNAGLTDGFGNMVELANIDTGVTAWQTNVTTFGENIGQTDPAGVGNQTGFLGRPQLAPQGSGLIDMNARSYDPNLGRFISVDPMSGSAIMPQSMNPYSYGANNPFLWPDPTGMSIFSDTGDAVSGAANDVADIATDTVDSAWDATEGGRQYLAGAAQNIGDGIQEGYYLMKQAAKKSVNWILDHRNDIIAVTVVVAAGACIVATGGGCAIVTGILLTSGTVLNSAQFAFRDRSLSGLKQFGKDQGLLLAEATVLRYMGGGGLPRAATTAIDEGMLTAPRYAKTILQFPSLITTGGTTAYDHHIGPGYIRRKLGRE